jgi:hypothetical protein
MAEQSGLDPSSEPFRPPVPLRLSLVIPAYNEELRLNTGFARLLEAIQIGAIDGDTTEFIVVDDGSTDATASLAQALLASLPHVNVIQLGENQGKGAAVRAGIAAATAPAIIFADADMAIDPTQTPQFIEALTNADLAIGSRAASGATVDRPSISRSLMNRMFNRLVNTLTRVSLDDTQCGFKAFNAPTAKLLFHCTVTTRMGFDVEVLLLARRLGLTITQVPVHWLRVKGSHVRSWADSVSMVHDVFRVRRAVDNLPPIQGIQLSLPPRPSLPGGDPHSVHAYLKSLSGRLPVLRQENGEFLVLFPLVSDIDVTTQIERMTQQLNGIVLQRISITTARLRAMAPLTLSWDNAEVSAPVA